MTDNSENLPDTTTREETIDLMPLIPLAKQFLDNQASQAEENQKLQEKQLGIAEKRLEFEWASYKHRFWLVASIVAGFFFISGGIIFFLEDVDTGLSVLSHIGAALAGLVAGIGYEKARSGSK